MNIANKLTVFRVILVPFFVIFMLTDFTDYNRWIAFAIFVIATITDKLDGTIAHKYNMVTNFGKFMDPIADKLLVCSALICLTATGEVPAWVTILIIGREFAISGIRLVAADNDVAIAATWWGKSKTIAQMAMIIIILMNVPALHILGQIVMYVSVVLTVVSLVDYIIKNKNVLVFEDK
ncbi:MAG: CDP-diacylglycerol--glycerol-3-phosphate 3-phosphatidyltransferase [Ruminococcaceae bacterium]|nr:CDP-diacylglycerol--glycerol-3-phosphate 3-phosphatidyltransferase [Oscillospiraceae bacterium]MBQ9914090.1 CDP-diacylglycerol--glycerol-3-phosphate 3-phosphatidyltransferase [Clostridia bacterium]